MRDCVLVVGSGMMGSGIGAMSALAGNKTILLDVDQARVAAGLDKAALEAAALAKCTLFGPHTFNFRQTVEVLLQGQGALQVTDGDELRRTMEKCLSDPAWAEKIAASGQAVIRQNQGATARTMAILREVLRA